MDVHTPPARVQQLTPFDRSLELRELRDAAAAYASRHGEPGSAAYRSAWLRFRRHVKSLEDLQRLRDAARRKPAARSKPRQSRS